MKKTLLAALYVSASCFTLNAATWTVTSNAAFDGSLTPVEGTLGHVAASAANGDIITFASSLDGQTILFSAKLTFKSGSSAVGVTIDASNLENGIIFDGTSSTQILGLGDNYSGGVAQNRAFAIKNVTFKNGNSTADAGGACTITATEATFENCRFIENKNTIATPNGYEPGAIRVPTSFSIVKFENCLFKDNATVAKGGVISADASDLTFNNCLFNGNQSVKGGAAIVLKSATPNPLTNDLVITNCSFVGNTATNCNDDGIVILNAGSSSKGMPIKLANCTFIDNNCEGTNKSTIYSAYRGISIFGCLMGNNKSSSNFVAADVKINSGNSSNQKIAFEGYNVAYQYHDYDNQSFEDKGTNVRYSTWTADPYVAFDAAKGVCVPSDKAITDGYWMNIYNIPTADMKVTTDQLGNARGAKGCIGAYQFAHQLTMVDAQGTTTPAAGTCDYLKGSLIALSSTNSNCTFNSNGQKVDSPITLNGDMTITADYSSSIANLKIDGVSIEGGVLFVKGKAGKVLNIFGIGGNLLLSTTIQSDAAAINLNGLGRVILVQLDGERIKLVL